MQHETPNPDAKPFPRQDEMPEGDTPAVFTVPTGVAHCLFCPGRHLRLSRVRFFDLFRILLFQLPVRCGRCGQRQYAPPLVAALHGRHKVMRGKLRQKQPEQSWASWTGDIPGQPKPRPLTTVAEPRAGRLQNGPDHDDSV
ncbi:MAG: hypothetical protein JSS87_09745 [Acidobacteria bacterium]|nr:hypothetical protein [Acidobacteriota bacterium]